METAANLRSVLGCLFITVMSSSLSLLNRASALLRAEIVSLLSLEVQVTMRIPLADHFAAVIGFALINAFSESLVSLLMESMMVLMSLAPAFVVSSDAFSDEPNLRWSSHSLVPRVMGQFLLTVAAGGQASKRKHIVLHYKCQRVTHFLLYCP